MKKYELEVSDNKCVWIKFTVTYVEILILDIGRSNCEYRLEGRYGVRISFQRWTVFNTMVNKKNSELKFVFIIWLCLRRIGNYRIHKFDRLILILKAVNIFPCRPVTFCS